LLTAALRFLRIEIVFQLKSALARGFRTAPALKMELARQSNKQADFACRPCASEHNCRQEKDIVSAETRVLSG
jgi:hypothetical protein